MSYLRMHRVHTTDVVLLDSAGRELEVEEYSFESKGGALIAIRHAIKKQGYTECQPPGLCDYVPPEGIRVIWFECGFTVMAGTRYDADNAAQDICEDMNWDTHYWENK